MRRRDGSARLAALLILGAGCTTANRVADWQVAAPGSKPDLGFHIDRPEVPLAFGLECSHYSG